MKFLHTLDGRDASTLIASFNLTPEDYDDEYGYEMMMENDGQDN